MALVPKASEGYEAGVLDAYGAAPAGLSASTAAARSGTYGLLLSPAANTAAEHTVLGSYAKPVTRFALRVPTRPASGSVTLFTWTDAVSATAKLRLSSLGVLSLVLSSGASIAGPTLDTTSFHLIELQGTTNSIDWKVDGVLQTRATTAWNSTINGTSLGRPETTEPAYTAHVDDLIQGTWGTAATDWWGDGYSLGYTVTSDGTHSFTASDFSTGDAGTQQAPTFTTFFQMVDDAAPWSTTRSATDNIAQRVIRTTGYVELKVGGAAEPTAANSAQALMAYSASSTAADTAGCIAINGDAVAVAVRGDLPVAQGGLGGALAAYAAGTSTANAFARGPLAVPAAGWSATEVNKVKWRFGGSSDINPVPTAQALMIEVDWQPAPVRAGWMDRPSIVGQAVGRAALWMRRKAADALPHLLTPADGRR